MSKEKRRLQQMVDAQVEIKMLEAKVEESRKKYENLKRIDDESGGDFMAKHNFRQAAIELDTAERNLHQAKKDEASASVLPEELDAAMEKLPI
jgi:hypothetical protein